jgi:hypothetical protein
MRILPSTARLTENRLAGLPCGPAHHRGREKKRVAGESVERGIGRRSRRIVPDHAAAATLDDDPPLLEIIG